jgi:hypothetical protein
LSNKVVQYDQIPLRYVQVICVVDVFGDALIKLDSRHRSHHIKIGGLPLTITSNDTLRRWTYSFLCILQERFYTYRLAALGTPSYDTCERMLHNNDNNTGLGWSARSVSCILVTWTVTWSWEWFVTNCARMRHVRYSATKRWNDGRLFISTRDYSYDSMIQSYDSIIQSYDSMIHSMIQWFNLRIQWFNLMIQWFNLRIQWFNLRIQWFTLWFNDSLYDSMIHSMIQWFTLWFNDSILGFNYSILWFNDSILGFNDSILWFNDSILGFNDSILWFNDSILGFNDSILWINDSILGFNDSLYDSMIHPMIQWFTLWFNDSLYDSMIQSYDSMIHRVNHWIIEWIIES